MASVGFLRSALAADAAATNIPLPVALVDALNALSHGPHAGYRANHAKAVMVEGMFTPSPGAVAFSKAPHFAKPAPVLVRFSDTTGVPNLPDAGSPLWALCAAGWATVLVMTFLINHFDLFGLRQVWLPLIGKPYTPVTFLTPLPYRVIRHPLYFGFLLAFWMTPTMTLADLLFACATTAYIVVAIQFEERDLVAEHGADYEKYRRAVPMLVPGLKPRAGS